MFDPHAPQSLVDIQKWMIHAITTPLGKEGKLPHEFENRAAELILPSSTLNSLQRVELYHRQYWWRLLKCLYENFPMVTRLFGYSEFNKVIGIPYLTKNTPSHWALCRLGTNLPEWIRSDYQAEDQSLIAICADIDWAANQSNWIKKNPSLEFATLSPEQILNLKLYLQPDIQVFALKADLFSFREAFLKEDVDHWNTHPFPTLSYGDFYFAIYRSIQNNVVWKELSYAEYKMLSFFKQGLTINEACEKIEEEGGEVYQTATEQIPLWFQEWTFLKWFCERE